MDPSDWRTVPQRKKVLANSLHEGFKTVIGQSLSIFVPTSFHDRKQNEGREEKGSKERLFLIFTEKVKM
jgi:hypothetical protein